MGVSLRKGGSGCRTRFFCFVIPTSTFSCFVIPSVVEGNLAETKKSSNNCSILNAGVKLQLIRMLCRKNFCLFYFLSHVPFLFSISTTYNDSSTSFRILCRAKNALKQSRIFARKDQLYNAPSVLDFE